MNVPLLWERLRDAGFPLHGMERWGAWVWHATDADLARLSVLLDAYAPADKGATR